MALKDRSGGKEHLPLKVWDLPVRLFHWCLVVLIIAAWLTAEYSEMEWHARIGQAILTLIVFRIFWGIFGSQTAQFWNFVKGPFAVIAYAKSLVTGKDAPTMGHNPLGACMIVGFLVLIGAQSVFGLFANDDIFFEGPLFHLVDKETSDSLTGLHHLVFNLILICAAIHIAAALFYLIFKRDNLIGPMITGTRWWPAPLPQLRRTPNVVALVLLAGAAALVWAAVNKL